MDDVNDRIEKSISIAADQDAVWSLISEPGWFVNQGTIVDHRIEQLDDHVLVHDVGFGTFAIRTEALERPRYAAFRWFSSPIAGSDEGPPDFDGQSTLVEFFVDEEAAGSVRLRVVESGFASLTTDAVDRRARFDENSSGWESELHVAHDHLRSVVA